MIIAGTVQEQCLNNENNSLCDKYEISAVDVDRYVLPELQDAVYHDKSE